MILNNNKFFYLVLLSLMFAVSCTGSMNNAPVSGPSTTLADNPLDKGQRLANWESQPQVVGKGNGLQLMLKTSEGMNFIYAGYQGKGGQDLFYMSSHNVGDTFSKPYSINKVPGEVSAHGENGPLLQKGAGH